MPLSPRLLRPANNFTPRSISGLALWLDAADTSTLYTTDAGAVVPVASPLDIATPSLWLDGADSSAASMTLNGSLVETWKDKSGNSRDFTAASTARPTLTPSAINAKSAVTFDGSANTMTGNAAAQDVIRNLAGYTVFAVLRTATVAAGERLAFGVGATVIFRSGQTDSRSFIGGRRVGGDTLESVTGASGELTAGAAFVQSAVVNHTAQSLTGLRNGVVYNSDTTYMAAGVSDNVASAVSVGTQAGGTYGFWNGEIAEIIVYPTALTTADRARVEAYLAAKWGITGVHAQAAATSDPVGYWGDKSGNARHATQSTAGSRPSIAASNINNRRAISFGTASSGQRLGWLPGSGDQNWQEIFQVGVHDLGASTFSDLHSTFSGFNTNSGTGLGVGWLGEQGQNLIATGVSFIPQSNLNTVSAVSSTLVRPFPTINSPFILVARASGAVGVAGYVVGNDRQFASGRNWRGRIVETIAFERTLTATERSRIVRYLAAKYGIALAPQVSNADAQDWINRVYANGGTVSSITAAAVNQFCIDTLSIRDRFYRLNLICGGTSGTAVGLNSALVPLYRGVSVGSPLGNTADTNFGVFAGGDYAENSGLTGNGTSRYLDTGLAPSALPSYTSSHVAVYHSQPSGTNQTRAWVSCRDTAAASQIYLSNGMFSTSAVFGQYMGNATANFNTGGSQTGAAGGFRVLSRTAIDRIDNYYNAVSQANSTTDISGGIAGVTSTRPFFIFANNNQGTADSFMNGRLMGYSIGLGLSQAQVDVYNAAMQAFQTAMGRTV